MLLRLLLLALPLVFGQNGTQPEDFSLLFCISGASTKPPRTFETISPSTGKVVQKGKTFQYTYDAQGLSSIDDRRGIYYMIGRNESRRDILLVGISTDTGDLLSETPLPFLREAFVGVGEYVDTNSHTGHSYCTGRSEKDGKTHELWDIDPVNHKKKLIANVGDRSLIEVLGGVSVYDPGFGVEWIQLARNDSGRILLRFYGYDVNTGFLVNIIDDQMGMSSMEYDLNTQRIFGMGASVVGKDIVLSLVRFDSDTVSFHKVADIPDYHLVMDIEFAINHRARKAYAFMSKQKPAAGESHRYRRPTKPVHGGPPMPSFDLVTISLDTGKVLHSVPYCKNIFGCPWSVEYQ